MPRIMPEPRYFSMPSSVVGAVALRKEALNCRPWVRSLTHTPEPLTHSPAEIRAVWPTTVTGSRWPRTLTRSTQKPVSALWKVTRSTRPASASVDAGLLSMLAISPSRAGRSARRAARAAPTLQLCHEPLYRHRRRPATGRLDQEIGKTMPLVALSADGSRLESWALDEAAWDRLKQARGPAEPLRAACCGAPVTPVTSPLGLPF